MSIYRIYIVCIWISFARNWNSVLRNNWQIPRSNGFFVICLLLQRIVCIVRYLWYLYIYIHICIYLFCENLSVSLLCKWHFSRTVECAESLGKHSKNKQKKKKKQHMRDFCLGVRIRVRDCCIVCFGLWLLSDSYASARVGSQQR